MSLPKVAVVGARGFASMYIRHYIRLQDAGRIDWALNREWLRLVADSGTALFLSTDPDLTGEEHIRDMLQP